MFLQRLQTYLIFAGIVIGIGLTFLVLFGKVESHLGVNYTHTPFQDFLFKWITYLGDGRIVAIGALIVSLTYIKRYRWSAFFLGLFTLFLSGVIVQFLKHAVFYDAYRPTKFISKGWLNLVSGVDMHTMNSFPSGHTTAAFAFFTYLAFLYWKKTWFQMACLVLAILAGYSRIYLSQHFLEDVVAGSILGITCFLLGFLLTRILPLKENITKSA